MHLCNIILLFSDHVLLMVPMSLLVLYDQMRRMFQLMRVDVGRHLLQHQVQCAASTELDEVDSNMMTNTSREGDIGNSTDEHQLDIDVVGVPQEVRS